ncbi:PAS domain S-box protein [Solidesulfovibrio sp.]|uniref:PAS domain S-box protein n=1 Tax=Solidesulfovibrio sp. TaxID=2910990 RepID=UPI002630E5E4|nr:PAS domain S-box protein [Solidesulfovibrio sp.]
MNEAQSSSETLAREVERLRRELAQRERLDVLTAAALGCIRSETATPELLREIVTLLARETGFDAVGLRLREGDDFPYFQTRGLSEEFIRLENNLCPKGSHGQPALDADGAPLLECACGMVLQGRLDRNEPFVTEYGSFWSNANTELVRRRPELLDRIRGNCIASGYESSALVPLRCDDTTYGLLQFEDKRRDMFTPQLVRGLELIARHLALALSLRQAIEELRTAGRDLAQRITERTRELGESEKKFRMLANAIPQLAWIARADGHLIWYNDRWYAYTGTTPEQMEGWGWKSVHDPAVLPAVMEKWRDSIATGEPFDMVFPLLGADGRFRPFLTRVNPQRDASGRVLQWFGTNTDISEQKRMEEELREREELLRLFIEHAPAAIAMFDRRMRYMAVSRRWLADYGLAGRELVGRSHYDIFPEISQRWKDIHQRCLAGAVERAEEDPFTRADGSTQWVRWEVRPWYTTQDVVGGIVVCSEDISERKQAQQALRERETQFTTVFQASPAPMAIVTYEDSRYLHVNEAYLRLTGYAGEEIIGKNSLELGIWRDLDVRENIRARFAAGERITDAEAALRTKSGAAVSVLLSIERMEIDGKSHMLSVATDITEHKRAEELLRHSRDALEVRVRERTRELEARNAELENFSYITSHDLQEPLRKVRVFGERLRLEYAAVLEEDGRDYLLRMENAAARMQSLISDLLEYSQVSMGEHAFAASDLGELARQAAQDFDHALAQAGGEIEIGDLPRAEVDGALMRQVFANLISNALKYHGRNPPKVRIGGEVVTDAGRAMARISIEDNGIGFAEQYKEKIFQPFQRLHGKKAYEGTGIGLAIVRKVLERHKGTITVASEPDKGSCFIMTLPVEQRA